MGSDALAVLLLVVWVGAGLLAALVLLGRQGYRGWRWYAAGAVLGPLLVPVAAERADRSVAVLEHGPDVPGAGTTVVVGVDGSPGGDEAVRLAAGLAAAGARVVLVTVVDPDAVDGPDDDERRVRAGALLAARAGWFGGDGGPVTTEVVAGQPARALLAVAEARGAAMIVVGRRGRGPRSRLLGDVASRLAHHAPVPVLLAAPPAGQAGPVEGTKGPATQREAGSPSRP